MKHEITKFYICTGSSFPLIVTGTEIRCTCGWRLVFDGTELNDERLTLIANHASTLAYTEYLQNERYAAQKRAEEAEALAQRYQNERDTLRLAIGELVWPIYGEGIVWQNPSDATWEYYHLQSGKSWFGDSPEQAQLKAYNGLMEIAADELVATALRGIEQFQAENQALKCDRKALAEAYEAALQELQALYAANGRLRKQNNLLGSLLLAVQFAQPLKGAMIQ